MLNKQEKKDLKKKVHHLKPVVMIGANGLTDAVHVEIDKALKAHELIKIKVATDDRDVLQGMIDEICERNDAELIQTIGHMIAVYRQREAD